MYPSHNSNHSNTSSKEATQNELIFPQDTKVQKTMSYMDKVWDIRTSDAVDEGALAFMARCFIQATLPHSDPGDVPLWGRRNGIYTLTIKPSYIFDSNNRPKNIGLPYGSIPRLLFIWMTTEALQTKEPRLRLGNSLSEFMNKLGFSNTTGGKNGSITRLKNQAYKLFRSEFTLSQELNKGIHEKDLKVSNERMLFWNDKFPEQKSLWESWVTLTPEFFESITKNPAPLDMRALKALKNSSMALDIYMWLSHRTFYLDKPQHLSWKALQGQLGADYNQEKTLRQNVRKAVNKIKVFWPELNADFDNPEIITLYPSKSLISPKEARQGKLLFSR